MEDSTTADSSLEAERAEETYKGRVRDIPVLIGRAVGISWRADRISLITIILLEILNGVGIAIQVRLVQKLLETAIGNDRTAIVADVAWIVGFLVFITVGSQVIGAFREARREILSEQVTREAMGDTLRAATTVDLITYESPDFYNLLQRTRDSAAYRPQQVVQAVVTLASSVCGTVGAVAAMLAMQPLVAVVMFAALVPVWLMLQRNAMATFEFNRDITELERRRRYVAELLGDREAAQEVRAFQFGDSLLRLYETLSLKRLGELRDVIRDQTKRLVVGELSGAIMSVLVMAYIVVAWALGHLSLPIAGGIIVGLLMLRELLAGVSYGMAELYESALFLMDDRMLQKYAADVARRRPTKPGPERFEKITLEEVSFSYPSSGKNALEKVSLEISHGEVIALVGEDGSGKTTLAKILANLYTPTGGRVLWDGVDLATVHPESPRKGVGVVFQNFQRYYFSAADNIAIGNIAAGNITLGNGVPATAPNGNHTPEIAAKAREAERNGVTGNGAEGGGAGGSGDGAALISGADMAAIERAAALAGADEVLATLPEGLNTQLGPQFEGGQDLSLGQWQRLALARAFFRDAPFVILDEPTASLDAMTEYDLYQRIRTLASGRTVVLISHRFSTVRTADRIYVMDKGRIIEEGDHETLMRLNGVYARMFTIQASAYA